MFEERAVQKNLTLKIETSNDIPDVIIGDPTRLTQIIINLMSNATKFSEKGTVLVCAELLELSKETRTVKILFRVKDNGIGMSEDALKKIFKRFSQARSDINRVYGGSGLGLNIVKELVDLQGGTIEVESQPGIGTEFKIILPFKMAGKNTVLKDKTEPNVINIFPGSRVLIVEDNKLNQDLAKTILGNSNYICEVANNGKEALGMVSASPYDIILMDLQMPEMDGYSTSENIRKSIDKKIPIIAMTAHAMPGERDKCLAHGMNDYISKPFREEELISKLNFHIEKTRNESAPDKMDLHYLRSLPGSNKEFVNQILRTFMETVPSMLKILEEKISIMDYLGIKAAAHSISSNLISLGYKTAGAELYSMEEAASKGNQAFNYAQSLDVVTTAVFNAVEEINKLLNE
jgi:CheY-like chemotaxis protein